MAFGHRYMLRIRYALRGKKGFISYRNSAKRNYIDFAMGKNIEPQAYRQNRISPKHPNLKAIRQGISLPDVFCRFSGCRDTAPAVSERPRQRKRTPEDGCPYGLRIGAAMAVSVLIHPRSGYLNYSFFIIHHSLFIWQALTENE